MDRRNAMKIAAGFVAGGGIGMFAMAKLAKYTPQLNTETKQLNYQPEEGNWIYTPLESELTAKLAYQIYPDGSCMYATVKSVISQLAEIHGEPFASYPCHMFKYGHGGIGGYGTICGTLNGAAALLGLFVTDKVVRDTMITDLFQWYEKSPHPKFKPESAEMELPAIASNSVLCHASNTLWCKETGFEIESKERKERCRRLAADVSAKVVESLNAVFSNTYTGNTHCNETTLSCMACHGNEGKLKNTNGKMNCTSCHDQSVGHRVFSDVHYRLIKEKH